MVRLLLWEKKVQELLLHVWMEMYGQQIKMASLHLCFQLKSQHAWAKIQEKFIKN